MNEKVNKMIQLLQDARHEMANNKLVLLKRGDLINEDNLPLYKETIEELESVEIYIQSTREVKKAYRHLQMNVFMKNESFFMDLFETREFPCLFELFEFE